MAFWEAVSVDCGTVLFSIILPLIMTIFRGIIIQHHRSKPYSKEDRGYFTLSIKRAWKGEGKSRVSSGWNVVAMRFFCRTHVGLLRRCARTWPPGPVCSITGARI